MAAHRALNLALAAIFCVAILAVLVPAPAQAQSPGSWTTELSSGIGDGVIRAKASHDGERLGIAFSYASNAKVGFILRTAANTWSLKSSDVSGTALTNLYVSSVLNVGPAKWVVSAVHTSATLNQLVYRSTDDGATWTQVYSDSASATQNWGNLAGSGNLVGFAYSQSSNIAKFTSSSDGGATWATAYSISDNRGSPTQSSGTDIFPNTGALSFSAPSGFAAVLGSYGAGFFRVSTTDGAFWTTPYTADGGSTLACIAYCGGSDGGGPSGYEAPVGGLTSAGTDESIIGQVRPGFTNTYTTINGGALFPSGAPTCGPISGTGNAALNNNQPVNPAMAANSVGVGLYAYGCSNPTNDFKILFQTSRTASWSSSFTSTSNFYSMGVDMTATLSYVLYQNAAVGNRLELLWTTTPTGSAIQPTATHTFSGAEGTPISFALDPLNKVVAVKTMTTGPTNIKVRSYDPASLNARGTALDTMCNADKRVGIVAQTDPGSGKQFIGASTCFQQSDCGGIYCVSAFSIRSSTLGTPDYAFAGCNSSCDYDLSSAAGDLGGLPACAGSSTYPLPGGIEHASQVASKPITYLYTGHDSFSGGVQSAVAFLFSDYGNGNMGGFIERTGSATTEKTCGFSTPFTSSGQVAQMCSWKDPTTGNDYLGATSPSSATTIWTVQTDAHFSDALTNAPFLQLNPVGSFPAPWSTAQGIACAGGYAYVLNMANQVQRLSIGTGFGSTSYPTAKTAFGGLGALYESQPIDVSQDGYVLTFQDTSTTWAVANSTTGTVAGELGGCPGTLLAAKLTDGGNVEWGLTTTTLCRYDLLTTSAAAAVVNVDGTRNHGASKLDGFGGTVPITSGGGSTGTSTGSQAQGGIGGSPVLPGVDLCGLAAQIPVDCGVFVGLAAIVIIMTIAFGCMASGAKLAGPEGAKWGGGVGFAGGFVLTLFLGMMPPWVLIAFGLIGAAIFAFTVLGRG